MVNAVERAAEGVIDEAEGFKREHAGELCADVMRALRDKAVQLRDRTREVAVLYAQIENGRQDLEKLAPPPEAVEDDSEAGPTTYVIGLSTMQSVGGPNRGDIESVLAYLGGIADEFPEPVPEATEGAGVQS